MSSGNSCCTLKYFKYYFVFTLCFLTVLAQRKDSSSGAKKSTFVCPEGDKDGNYADPISCKRFYQCIDNYPYLNLCPSGLYFDDINKLCTSKSEATCGPIHSTGVRCGTINLYKPEVLSFKNAVESYCYL